MIYIGKVLISMGSSAGIYSDDLTATRSDILKGTTALTSDSDDEIVEGTLELTGNSLASNVEVNKTFYNTDAKNKVTGTLRNVTKDSSIDHSSTNTTTVVTGDTAYVSINSDGITRAEIRFNDMRGVIEQNTCIGIEQTKMASAAGLTGGILANNNTVLGVTGTYKGLGNATTDQVLSGSKFSTASLSNATGTMTNNGGVNKFLDPGGSYTIAKGYHNGTGKITAKNKIVKQLGVAAMRGFNSDSYDLGPYEESFTMPTNGTVYYNGISASYAAKGTVVCEIYKNGTVVDSRNIDGSNDYVYRSTMMKQSFSVSSGDIIKVKASVSSGTHQISAVYATIIYFT